MVWLTFGCLFLAIWIVTIEARPLVGTRLLRLRGGGTNTNSTTTNILVSTSIGSSFLDKSKKISLPSNAKVVDLKEVLRQKFPGSPPTALQRLFHGGRPLSDNELVSNISSLPTVPILLDLISGCGAYNKTLSVSQALEAYAASTVHLTYLSNQLRLLASGMLSHRNNESNLESAELRQLLQSVNETLHRTYVDEISAALEAERNPEVIGADTVAWRGRQKQRNPLLSAIAKEFDLNLRGVRAYFYFSALLLICAKFGTDGGERGALLLLLIPALWISKLRQVRLLLKIATYMLLPVTCHVDFLLPLLPAPGQVIAKVVTKMPSNSFGVEEDGEGVVEEEEEEEDDDNEASEDPHSDEDEGAYDDAYEDSYEAETEE